MKLRGIHHCSVLVTDMERAVKFYKTELIERKETCQIVPID